MKYNVDDLNNTTMETRPEGIVNVYVETTKQCITLFRYEIREMARILDEEDRKEKQEKSQCLDNFYSSYSD